MAAGQDREDSSAPLQESGITPDYSTVSDELDEMQEDTVPTEVMAQDLEVPSCADQATLTPASLRRLRAVHVYAGREDLHIGVKFRAGWTNFEETESVYGCYFTTPSSPYDPQLISLPWTVFPPSGPFPFGNLSAAWLGVHRWAHNFQNQTVYETAMPVCYSTLNRTVLVWAWRRDPSLLIGAQVPQRSLVGEPSWGDSTALIRSVNRYGYDIGYVGAIPNFEMADYGQGVVYGAYYFKPGAPIVYRDVPKYILRGLGSD